MSYFVGLDVLLRSVSVCIIDQEGLIVLEQSVDCEAETINICLHSFKDQITKVGFEAGVMSQTLFYGLQELGYDLVCMEARHVSAALSAMRNKTDKNDARGIAASRTVRLVSSRAYEEPRRALYSSPAIQPEGRAQ